MLKKSDNKSLRSNSIKVKNEENNIIKKEEDTIIKACIN